MNTYNKKHTFFNGLLAFFQAQGNPFLSSKMKPSQLFLLLFSGLCFTVGASNYQVPAKPKPAVAATKSTKPAVAKGKKKGKKLKKVIIKKDSMPDIDPANANSPLYQKNNL